MRDIKTSIFIIAYAIAFTSGAAFSLIVTPPVSLIKTCFVPGQRCDIILSQRIDKARESIDVQAYHITNTEIIDALIRAHRRGVHVRLIVDKKAVKEITPFSRDNIPVYVDYKRAIAHNKVMIIDGAGVITGSFNFTEGAQKRNVENWIDIEDKGIAKQYEENFESRLLVSKLS